MVQPAVRARNERVTLWRFDERGHPSIPSVPTVPALGRPTLYSREFASYVSTKLASVYSLGELLLRLFTSCASNESTSSDPATNQYVRMDLWYAARVS